MKNLFLPTIIILSFIGCSSGRPDPTQPDLLVSSHNTKISKLAESPSVYETDIQAGSPVYATAIRECGLNENTPNQSFTRELFVGFDNPIIISQSEKTLASRNILCTLAQAKLENSQVTISVYSLREDDCITDLLFWTTAVESFPSEAIDQFVTETMS